MWAHWHWHNVADVEYSASIERRWQRDWRRWPASTATGAVCWSFCCAIDSSTTNCGVFGRPDPPQWLRRRRRHCLRRRWGSTASRRRPRSGRRVRSSAANWPASAATVCAAISSCSSTESASSPFRINLKIHLKLNLTYPYWIIRWRWSLMHWLRLIIPLWKHSTQTWNESSHQLIAINSLSQRNHSTNWQPAD